MVSVHGAGRNLHRCLSSRPPAVLALAADLAAVVARHPGQARNEAALMPSRIVATFDKVGQWVWHCHILSHEDHEMMRRYQVVD